MNSWMDYLKWGNLTSTGKMMVISVTAVLAMALVAVVQNHYEKKHEQAAAAYDVLAKTSHEKVAQLELKLNGAYGKISELETAAQAVNAKYETARKKVPIAPLPTPVGEPALAQGLKELGLGNDLEVHLGVPSVVNVTDAGIIFSLGQEAARAKALDEALILCAQAKQATEAVVQGQQEALNLSAGALTQAKQEASERASQAQELGKALKVEKAKDWQKYAWGAAGIGLTLLVKK